MPSSENTLLKPELGLMLEEEDENSNTGGAKFKDDWEDDENWTDPHWEDNLCWSKGQPPATGHSPKKELPSRKDAAHQKEGLVSRMLLNDNKAGMEGLDKEKINQIIYDASKGSRFYENEQKKDEQVNRRIEEQYKKMEKIEASELKQGLEEADMLLEELERARDLSYTIVHIDMDAFFAAVEMRDNPSLWDKPMAVGGNSMLSTSNYHARKFGVRAAMPGFIGKKLCPDLVIVPPNFEKYTSVSRQIRELMAEYDPNFCPMSLDEAYLDITEYIKKREKMSDFERSYLCRDTQNVSSTLCQCDLNSTLREKVLSQTASVGHDNSVLSHLSNKCNHVENGSCSRCVIAYSGMSSTNSDAEMEGMTSGDSENSTRGETSSKATGAGHSGQMVGEKVLHRAECFMCQKCGKICPDFRLVTFGFGADESVREMRFRIEQRTRLTASAGIAANMMLAKVCSDKNKPNGQYRLPNTTDAVMQFIKDLPIRKISGIGKVSEKMLNSIGIQTCTDLFNQRALLYHLYSPISFNYFMRISIGMGSTTVERDSERKSISTERTFRELSKPSDLYDMCRELCEALSEDLREERLKGKTVAIKLKTVAFDVKTRAYTLANHTSDIEVICEAARGLLRTEIQACNPQPLRLRLMGVRISSILHESLCKREKRQNTITGFIQQKPQKHNAELSNLDLQAIVKNVDISANEVDTYASKPDVDSEVTKYDIDTWDIVKEECMQSIGTCMQLPDTTQKEDPHTSILNVVVEASVEDKDLQAAVQKVDTAAIIHDEASAHSVQYEYKQSAVLISKDSCVMKEKDNKDDRAVGKCRSPKKSNKGPLDSFISAKSLSEQRNPSRKASFNHGNNSLKLGDLEEMNRISLVAGISDGSKQSRNEIHKTAAENVENSFNSESSMIYPAGLVTFLCPVCNKNINCANEEKMNLHIDVCLKGQSHIDENQTCSQTPDHSKGRNQITHEVYVNRTEENLNQICNDSKFHDLDTNRRQCNTHEKNESGNEPDSEQTEPFILSRGLKNDTTGESVLPDRNEKETIGLVCPVCYMEQRDQDLDAFNSHVDTCLSKGTISQILQEQRQNEKANLKRLSPGSASSSQQSSKKKKIKHQNQTRSITSYFK